MTDTLESLRNWLATTIAAIEDMESTEEQETP